MRKPERYDPRARSIGGPWKMVKCKDGPYVDFEQHQEIVAALAAENERLRKAGEWMPIETAPKDGTDIQIRVIMRYDKDAQGWAYFQNPQTTAEWMPLSNAAKEGRDAK